MLNDDANRRGGIHQVKLDGATSQGGDVQRLNFGQIIENEKRQKLQENSKMNDIIMDDSKVMMLGGRSSAMHGDLKSRSVS